MMAENKPNNSTGRRRAFTEIWHVVRFALNSPWTVLACLWGKVWGGTLRFYPGHFVICSAMRGGYARGGTTIGNVYLTGGSSPSKRLLRHETKHADQWALFGPLFPFLYALAELIGRGPKGNLFERWAGLEEGGYL